MLEQIMDRNTERRMVDYRADSGTSDGTGDGTCYGMIFWNATGLGFERHLESIMEFLKEWRLE